MEEEEIVQKGMMERTFDIPFYPYDDISYHQTEKDKTGIRCVAVVPNDCVKTVYVGRTFPEIVNIISKGTGCNMGQFYSQDLTYNSDGVSKTLCIIYTQDLIAGPDRDESSLGGSLNYLANL